MGNVIGCTYGWIGEGLAFPCSLVQRRSGNQAVDTLGQGPAVSNFDVQLGSKKEKKIISGNPNCLAGVHCSTFV